MRRQLAALALLVPYCCIGGCVAVAIPVAAAGAIGGKQVLGGHNKDKDKDAAPAAATVKDMPGGGQSQPMDPAKDVAPAPVAATTGDVPDTMKYLYGSGEAAALSEQAYNQLIKFLRARADDRIAGYPVASVVVKPGASLDKPDFEACGQKPLALVLDIDETSILNLGFEADQVKRPGGYDSARWGRWEQTGLTQVLPVPGALRAVNAARKMGVTVIFNSNRSTLNAGATADMLKRAGFGEVKLATTLFLRDPSKSSGKDARRDLISSRYCVVAMGGDQLGDFSDSFNTPGLTPQQRRAAVMNDQFSSLWGAGWFVLPNPVYGPQMKGDFDSTFPANKRWADPADAPTPDNP